MSSIEWLSDYFAKNPNLCEEVKAELALDHATVAICRGDIEQAKELQHMADKHLRAAGIEIEPLTQEKNKNAVSVG